MRDNVLLFLTNYFSFLNCKLWSQREKFQTIYNQTGLRLKKEMNIIKIIRSLRDLKILMKNSLLTPEMKKKIRQTHHNVIDLDPYSSES